MKTKTKKLNIIKSLKFKRFINYLKSEYLQPNEFIEVFGTGFKRHELYGKSYIYLSLNSDEKPPLRKSVDIFKDGELYRLRISRYRTAEEVKLARELHKMAGTKSKDCGVYTESFAYPEWINKVLRGDYKDHGLRVEYVDLGIMKKR